MTTPDDRAPEAQHPLTTVHPAGTTTSHAPLPLPLLAVRVTNGQNRVLFAGRVAAASSNHARRRALRLTIDRHGGCAGQYRARVRRVKATGPGATSPLAAGGPRDLVAGAPPAGGSVTAPAQAPSRVVPGVPRRLGAWPLEAAGWVALVPRDPAMRPLLSVALHASVLRGLLTAAAVDDTAGELDAEVAERLARWADAGPAGRRAEVARLVAAVVRLGGGVRLREPAEPPGDFWGAVRHAG